MPTPYRIYPYKLASQSAKALRDSLDGLLIKPEESTYMPRDRHHIINWGNSSMPNWLADGVRILNKPDMVSRATNKLNTLRILRDNGIACPEFTTNIGVARHWMDYESKVYARTVLNGHSGNGIVVCEGDDTLPDADLYTKGIDVKSEYRVHVFNGEVIDYIKKRRVLDDEPTDEENLVRSHENGWIFTRDNLRRLDRIEELAINAIRYMELDFGAVDIIRDFNNDCFVLEINSACGLEGTTLEKYTEAIQRYYANI